MIAKTYNHKANTAQPPVIGELDRSTDMKKLAIALLSLLPAAAFADIQQLDAEAYRAKDNSIKVLFKPPVYWSPHEEKTMNIAEASVFFRELPPVRDHGSVQVKTTGVSNKELLPVLKAIAENHSLALSTVNGEDLKLVIKNVEQGTADHAVRFVDNADGTVTDITTGLTWITDPHGLPGNLQPHTWDEAVKFCERLDYAHHTDWRLPAVSELQTLVDYGQKDSTLPQNNPFHGVPRSNAYWTSTTFVHNELQAWVVDLKFGASEYSNSKSRGCYVLPIRGQINREQDGAGQRATRAESKPEGVEKPQPESNVAPR